jgi:folate-binding protein YgfZ
MTNSTTSSAGHISPGLFDRSDRVRLQIRGPDRARFLHNLTTNEIKGLPVGRGCETFVTSPQGKTLAFISVLAARDELLVRADPGGLELALPHFRKYGVFDEIQLEDVSAATFELHLAGPRVGEILDADGEESVAADELSHAVVELGGRSVLVVRESPTGRPGLTLIGAVSDLARLKAWLQEAGKSIGLTELGAAEFEIWRIEAGTPVFGREVTERNLPQELGRDKRAISFMKGCYLGQETVARIDALGHVNQVLRGLRLVDSPTCPPPGAVLEAEGKVVGQVTSAAFSPGWGAPIALAFVRPRHATAGTLLKVRREEPSFQAVALVHDLPMLPPQ